jgi:hypothetical protein
MLKNDMFQGQLKLKHNEGILWVQFDSEEFPATAKFWTMERYFKDGAIHDLLVSVDEVSFLDYWPLKEIQA